MTNLPHKPRPEMLKVKDAALLLGMSDDTVRRGLEKGDIAGLKVNGTWRVSRRWLWATCGIPENEDPLAAPSHVHTEEWTA